MPNTAILMETFSHEHADGGLVRSLERKLAAHGVKPAPIPRKNVFAILEGQGRIDSFTLLVATFLQHFKSADSF